MPELFRYQDKSGKEPFTKCLMSLRDKTAQARIRVKLRQVEAGNPGDVQPVGEGVSEMRIHLGQGYRIYFGQHGKTVVILLCGGDKGSQSGDIADAEHYWKDWKRRQA